MLNSLYLRNFYNRAKTFITINIFLGTASQRHKSNCALMPILILKNETYADVNFFVFP